MVVPTIKDHVFYDYPLHLACQGGNEEMVTWILQMNTGDDRIPIMDCDCRYPWDRACDYGHSDLALMLIEHYLTFFTEEVLRSSLLIAIDSRLQRVILRLVQLLEEVMLPYSSVTGFRTDYER